jgi:hypothetical protein
VSFLNRTAASQRESPPPPLDYKESAVLILLLLRPFTQNLNTVLEQQIRIVKGFGIQAWTATFLLLQGLIKTSVHEIEFKVFDKNEQF